MASDSLPAPCERSKMASDLLPLPRERFEMTSDSLPLPPRERSRMAYNLLPLPREKTKMASDLLPRPRERSKMAYDSIPLTTWSIQDGGFFARGTLSLSWTVVWAEDTPFLPSSTSPLLSLCFERERGRGGGRVLASGSHPNWGLEGCCWQRYYSTDSLSI